MKPFELAPLPYAYDYLEPVIDAETMKLHHDKHHQAYVNNLNAAIAKYPDLPYGSASNMHVPTHPSKEWLFYLLTKDCLGSQ